MSFETLTVGQVGEPRGYAVSARALTHDIVGLADVPVAAWSDLADRAIEPNAFFQPAWALAALHHAAGASGARALLAWDGPSRTRLIGLLPVRSAWQALRLPLPVLVAWQAYAPLTTALLDRDVPDGAARSLLAAASAAGAAALLLPLVSDEGPVVAALARAAAEKCPVLKRINAHKRAKLDATLEAEPELKNSLGSKKLKELRRQRNRLAEAGEIKLDVARSPADVSAALDCFLKLEDAGWKGARGTALARHSGNARFIREAMAGLAAQGHAEIVTLIRGADPIAAGLVLRHGTRAYFIKVAYDESVAKLSPGVQLTLELTRHLCGDAAVTDADSVAVADHPMIDGIWRDRIAMADVLLPTRPGSSTFHLLGGVIAARHAARERARKLLHAIRSR